MYETVTAPVHPPAEADPPFPLQDGPDEQAPARPWWRRRAGLIVQWALVLGALAALPSTVTSSPTSAPSGGRPRMPTRAG